MSVPLGHKNHSTMQGAKKSFAEIYSKKYKIYKDCMALTLDGKILYRIDPKLTGEIVVPEGVERIDVGAFSRNNDLSVIVLPKSLWIWENACIKSSCVRVLVFKKAPDFFGGCFDDTSLLEIILYDKDDIEKIKPLINRRTINIAYKTEKWTCRRSIVTKEMMEHAKKDAFGVLYSEDGKILLKCRKKKAFSYVIPEGVDTIAQSAFEDCEITDVVMPKSMRVIGESAFENCHSLERVVLNNGLRHIFSSAFYFCEKMKSISLPDSLITMGYFQGCWGLTSIKLPSHITFIPGGALCKTSITEIQIPDTVERIGKRAFYLCKELKKITIPAGVEQIPEACFFGCSNLEEVHFAGKPKAIVCSAFQDCAKLKSIEIPEQERIEFDTFNGCSSLTHVEVPAGVIAIQNWAFKNCSSLNTLVLNEGLTAMCRCVENTAIKEIDIPASAIYFKFESLYGAKLLEKVTLKTVAREMYIDRKYLPSLKEIHIPAGTKNFFEECDWDLLIEDVTQ